MRDPSLLERFKEREDEIRRETTALDKEMSKKREIYEKKQADVLAKLDAARRTLAAMKVDYKALETGLAGKAKAALEAVTVTAEKVGSGEASIREYFNAGLSKDAIEAKTNAEAREKLDGAMKLIRAKAAEIFQLEFEEADARLNVIFCSTYPGQNQIARLKVEIAALEQGVSAVLYGSPRAAAERIQAENSIALCQDKGLSGATFDCLTYEELVDLRFDPRFTSKFTEPLEECIKGATPGQKYMLILNPGGFNREAGLTFRILDDDGTRRVVTT